MKKEDPFGTFKKYVTQTEDKELDGKLSIVEKYQKRIPELVARLNGCSECDLRKAGMFECRSELFSAIGRNRFLLTDFCLLMKDS